MAKKERFKKVAEWDEEAFLHLLVSIFSMFVICAFWIGYNYHIGFLIFGSVLFSVLLFINIYAMFEYRRVHWEKD